MSLQRKRDLRELSHIVAKFSRVFGAGILPKLMSELHDELLQHHMDVRLRQRRCIGFAQVAVRSVLFIDVFHRKKNRALCSYDCGSATRQLCVVTFAGLLRACRPVPPREKQ